MENPYIRSVVAASLLALVLTASANGQDAPKPRPGVAVTTWVVDQPTRTGNDNPLVSPGMARAIEARNDTTVPLAFTGVSFNNCRNISPTCGPVTIPAVVVAPGGTRVVMRVTSARPDQDYRFDYQLERRVATECLTAPLLTPNDTSRYHPPQSGTMIIPPLDKIRGKGIVSVQFFVAPSGIVDSVSVAGLKRASDVAVLVASAKRWQFDPATQDSCPVAGMSAITMTFR